MFKLEELFRKVAAASNSADIETAKRCDPDDAASDNQEKGADGDISTDTATDIPEDIENELDAIIAAENIENPEAVAGKGIRLLIISDSIDEADIKFCSTDDTVIVVKFNSRSVNCKALLAEIKGLLGKRRIDTLNLITGDTDSENLLLVDQFFWEEIADNMTEDATIELAKEEVSTATALEIEDITGRDVELTEIYSGGLAFRKPDFDGKITTAADYENSPDISVTPAELQAIYLNDPTNINLPPVEPDTEINDFEFTGSGQPDGTALLDDSSIFYDKDSFNSRKNYSSSLEVDKAPLFGFTAEALKESMNHTACPALQHLSYDSRLSQAAIQELQLHVQSVRNADSNVFFPHLPQETDFISTAPPVTEEPEGNEIIADPDDDLYSDILNSYDADDQSTETDIDEALEDIFKSGKKPE
ncbi:hypothetical protein P0136_08300 [Lentisphaerota bacterium ZTH]|nr:hypothetical protein JYG24_00590 [Lentisphaerota bacterium]WET05365.1 hypothetical protein P0136_08300 [Lentisphaerota bacterium ZTH]